MRKGCFIAKPKIRLWDWKIQDIVVWAKKKYWPYILNREKDLLDRTTVLKDL